MVSHVVSEDIYHWTDFGGLVHRLAPRILRLLVRGELAVHEDLVGKRFMQAGWDRWPEKQREAVSGVLDTWWHERFRATPPAWKSAASWRLLR